MAKSKINKSLSLVGGVSESGDGSIAGNKVLKIVIIVIIVIVVIWIIFSLFAFFYRKNNNEPLLIGQPIDASKPHMIDSSFIPTSSSHEFTMNFWIFCRDWNYNSGNPKCVLYWGDPNANKATPLIFLYPNTNNLMVRVDAGKGTETMNPFSCNNASMFNTQNACDVSNIPIQRWVMVTFILWNTTTDVYINGKLARSCTYPNIPSVKTGQNIYFGQGGGFNGYISRLKYFNYSIDPRKVYQLYRQGPYRRINIFQKFGMAFHTIATGAEKRWECVWGDNDNSGASVVPDPNAFTSEEGATNVCWGDSGNIGGDPATWGPSPSSGNIGGDPSTWTPKM